MPGMLDIRVVPLCNMIVFLKCVLCNTRSLLNKLDYLKLLQSCSVDVMLVMESWLDNSIPDSMIISQSDFNCYWKDRDRNGGGVCILVNSSINVIPVTLPKKFCHLEIVAIDVIGCNLKKTELLLFIDLGTMIKVLNNTLMILWHACGY